MKKPAIGLLLCALLLSGCPAKIQDAAKAGDLPTVRSQVEKNHDVINGQDDQGRTALQLAAANGQVQTVKYLIDQGADVNLADKDGDGPLHYAVMGRQAEVIRLLIASGADPQARDKKGLSPVHMACNRDLDLVRLLVELGASIKVEDKDGDTPLYFAVMSDKEEIVKYLVENGADVNHHNQKGETVLMQYAATGSFHQIFSNPLVSSNTKRFRPEPYLDMIRLLKDLGADLEARDQEGKTALHHVASVSRFDEAIAGAGISGTMVQVSLVDNVEGVQGLLDLGAEINARDNSERTPLHYAAMNDMAKVAKVLLQNGADLAAVDKDGLTPLQCAELEKDKNRDVIKVFNDRITPA